MDYTQQRREVALRRDPPVVGHIDALGYVVCLACGVTGKPIHHGATYSSNPCDKCGLIWLSKAIPQKQHTSA